MQLWTTIGINWDTLALARDKTLTRAGHSLQVAIPPFPEDQGDGGWIGSNILRRPRPVIRWRKQVWILEETEEVGEVIESVSSVERVGSTHPGSVVLATTESIAGKLLPSVSEIPGTLSWNPTRNQGRAETWIFPKRKRTLQSGRVEILLWIWWVEKLRHSPCLLPHQVLKFQEKEDVDLCVDRLPFYPAGREHELFGSQKAGSIEKSRILMEWSSQLDDHSGTTLWGWIGDCRLSGLS